MAADLTLIAIDNLPDAMTYARISAGRDLIEVEHTFVPCEKDCGPDFPLVEHDGKIGFWWTEDAVETGHVDILSWLNDWPSFTHLEVGPYSTMKAWLDDTDKWLPGPIVSLSRALPEPVVLTPAIAAKIMVSLNVPDNSFYKDWKKRTGNPVGFGTTPKIHRYPRYFSRRVAKRQWVRKWLKKNMGKIVWHEGW